VVNGKTYVGNYKNPFRVVNPISPDTNGFSTVWEMPATENKAVMIKRLNVFIIRSVIKNKN
jgi:hypothetical protein